MIEEEKPEEIYQLLKKREYIPEKWEIKAEYKDNISDMLRTSKGSRKLTKLINGKGLIQKQKMNF
jgi:hypothetical protein